MITAYGRDEAHRAASGLDIGGILCKPVTASALLDGVMGAMGLIASRETRASSQTQEASADLKKLAGARVLLVEDNEINQELAVELLTTNGISVAVANDGREALDMLDRESFDGVLMDCQMPVMDGYTATRKLRQDPRFKDLPILAMTANAMAGDRDKVLAAGMNDHIAKPINVSTMFHTMARWITSSNPGAAISVRDDSSKSIPELDGIDTDDALSRLQGNSQLYLRLLRNVRHSQGDFIQEFDAALAAGDWELTHRLAHTLKGVAGNIGAHRLHQACSVLEEQSIAHQVEQGQRDTVAAELSLVLNSLAKLDQEIGNAGEDQGDTDTLSDVLKELAQQLNDFDTSALNTVEAHRGLFIAGTSNEQFAQLERALADFDMAGAGEVAAQMLAALEDTGKS
jgi:CheY-like chemotaxis protein